MPISGSTLNLSVQAKLTTVTTTELNDIADGSGIIYLNESDENLIPSVSPPVSYPALGFATNDGSIVEVPYPGMEIYHLTVPELPTSLPTTNKAYALGLVEVSGDYALKWVLVDTDGNFNITPPSYYYITPSGAYCYNYDVLAAEAFLNGEIAVVVNGWDVNVPKKYSLDGGLTFSGIVTEDYGSGTSFFTISKLGNTNPTGQTIDLVISDSYDYVLYSDTIVITSPVYEVNTAFEGLDSNNAFDIYLVKTQDMSATTLAGTMTVYVTDTQTDCEYYYEIWDPQTATMLYYQDYSPAKTYQFAVSSSSGPSIQANAIVYKKVPGRVWVQGIDSNGDTIIDISHTALDYSKGDPNPANYSGLTPMYGFTEVMYSASEADGDVDLYMKQAAYDCIYKKNITFSQASNLETSPDMLVIEYDPTDHFIIDNQFTNKYVRLLSLGAPNSFFSPGRILLSMFVGSSTVFTFDYLGTISAGLDTAEILFYDALSGQPLTGTGAQIATISVGGNVSIDVKYYPYWLANPQQDVMIRFQYTELGGRIYLSDLIFIKNG
jgi:hypothetical protein